MQQQLCYDSFLIECCANSSLINQHDNGRFTSFCYSWITVSTSVELCVARKFNIQLFLWNQPSDASNEKVWAIVFEYIDGKMLSQTQITSEIANQICSTLRELHEASILHCDIRASNILVNNNWVYFVDLSVSTTIPHIKISVQELKELQEKKLQNLEIEFVFLSEICIDNCLNIKINLSPDTNQLRCMRCRYVTHWSVFSHDLWLDKTPLVAV